MFLLRALPPVCGAFLLAGCAATVTPVLAVPGHDKDPASFQKEEAACRSQAAIPTGQPIQNTSIAWQRYFSSYAACARAHGDEVVPVPWVAANVGFGVPYGYGYAPLPPYGTAPHPPPY